MLPIPPSAPGVQPAYNADHSFAGMKTPNGALAFPLRLTNQIAMKMVGMSTSTGGAAGSTWYMKFVAPGAFDAVQFVVEHGETSATTTYRMCCSATETILQDTDAHAFRPIVGGVEYSTLDAVDAYGHKTVTFSGVTPGASSILATAATSDAPFPVVADVLPLSSVPRSDGSAFCAINVRLSAIGGTSSFGAAPLAGAQIATALNGGFILQGSWHSDSTGAYVTAPQSNHPVLSNNNGGCPTVWAIFTMRQSGYCMVGIGDSLTQNQGSFSGTYVVPDAISAFGLQAAAAISATGTPCGWANFGFASRAMDVLTKAALLRLPLAKPNIVNLQSFSPNGPGANYTSDAIMRWALQQQGASVQQLIAAARGYNAAIFLGTGTPCSSTVIPNANHTCDDQRIAYNARHVVQMNRDITVVDYNKLVTDGGTPGSIPERIASSYDLGDNTHINSAGVALQFAALFAAIKTRFPLP